MAEHPHSPARTIFAARAMRRPLQSMRREIAGVRRNEDIECVHRMRVASRRLRNAFDLFGEELPRATRDRWYKQLKGVTKCLGAARDLDVQVDLLRRFLDDIDKPPATPGAPDPHLATASRLWRPTLPLRGGGIAVAALRPGIEHVLNTLVARRAAAQEQVLVALDRLESSRALAGLARWVKEQPGKADEAAPGSDELRAEAGRAVLDRLGDVLAYEPFVEQPDAARELHAMRIAAKHLRYTLEAYAPLYSGELAAQIDWVRHLQDWLGEIHDCDVWHIELGRMLAELPNRPPARRGHRSPRAGGPHSPGTRLTPGIEHLRLERSERRAAVYAEFVSAWRQAVATGYWVDFRRPFEVDLTAASVAPDGRPIDVEAIMTDATERGDNTRSRGAACGRRRAEDITADERLKPVLELAQDCHYEAGHTHQVTRLALRLFDNLAKLHGLDDERRFWLTCAGLLHDIGWVEGRAGHHKTALRLILESPLLPWDERLRGIVGSIARYHRKALPSEEHGHFAALSAADRADVRKLAALLRVADALDYSHDNAVDDVTCRVTAKRLSIRCTVTRSADVECERAVEKGDLAAEVFGREICVTWHLR